MRTQSEPAVSTKSVRTTAAFGGGAVIGTLGGLIGLGGAEFRLPLLIGVFRFGALESVILNKAMSLIVVSSALPFRARSVPISMVAEQWPIIVNVLAGSLLGAWLGAGWAIRLPSGMLHRIIVVLLVLIACVLLVHPGSTAAGKAVIVGSPRVALGVVAGLVGLMPMSA